MANLKRTRFAFAVFTLLLGLLCFPLNSFAQAENNSIHDTINQDDLGNVSDKFQENFFRALTQSAIENHENAITALLVCEKSNPEEAVVYFELGKNYFALKNYAQAESNLLKASKKKPDNRAILTTLYEVYYQTKNYPEAIKVTKQLTTFDLNYYENLANIYLLNQEYAPALKALDKIEAKKGENDHRSALRRQIFEQAPDKNVPITYLKNKIKEHPENTQSYVDLIYVYSADDQLEKAYQTARQLQKIHPDAPEAHLALYKVYQQRGEEANAVESMKIVLQSDAIGNDIKENVIKDFTAFVKKHPQYESDLVAVLGEESSEGNQSNQQLGEYYIGKDNAKAISFFKKALGETPNNFKLIKETLVLEVSENQFADAQKLAKRALDIFPSQPILYLLRGVSENGLQDYKAAEESLNIGVDFVIDNPKMEADFYDQLSKAYQGLGNSKKASEFQQKAEKIQKQKTK